MTTTVVSVGSTGVSAVEETYTNTRIVEVIKEGAQGPQGDIGEASINDLADVSLDALNDDEVLVAAGGVFFNQPVMDLSDAPIDGGTF
jgi:hypothetical protein